MKNKTILSILGILIAVVVIYALIPKPSHQQSDNNSVYCSSEGTITNVMPIQSHRSYCLVSDTKSRVYSANTPSAYSFSIIDDQGNIAKDFQITHTKQMHVIVVRKDLKYFQHIHPVFDETSGKFSFSDLTFPVDGEYRIFTDFAPVGVMMNPMGMPLMVTLSEDTKVGAAYNPEPLGSEAKTKTFDGYSVSLSVLNTNDGESMLVFDIKQNGKPVTDLEEYLGALGHGVILKEGTLDFIHAHPVETRTQKEGVISFMVDFPESGKYKVFTQFQRAGKVSTTDFVVNVPKGPNDYMEGMMPGMEH